MWERYTSERSAASMAGKGLELEVMWGGADQPGVRGVDDGGGCLVLCELDAGRRAR